MKLGKKRDSLTKHELVLDRKRKNDLKMDRNI